MAYVAIIDYGMGNLRSIYNKLKKLGTNCIITSQLNEIEAAEKIVLPGVGNFKAAMEKLNSLNLIEILNKKVLEDKVPILGICLGVQLFCKHSEEGDAKGLGWIDAEVVRFRVRDQIKYKVPHMGWNDVKIINSNTLDKSIKSDDQFYFVHSYHLQCNNSQDIWMTTNYDYEFVSAVHRENIYGTQFHPEKSHNTGFELLKRFADL
ncbi:MAG: imidazole glycerol phosphate synthase subunit HisH [Melioribacter sp.]|uniref:imidazole glycerol phosphate synthase subunit HisH n=1 Tax=Melioribacter sp. TaxID=2052167 RepID=UPI003BC25888